MKLSDEQKIEHMGVCVGCAGTIKYDGEAFIAHVFLGHLCRCEWRELGEVRSEWPGCHFVGKGKKTYLINKLQFVVGQKSKKRAWCAGTISTTVPSSLKQ